MDSLAGWNCGYMEPEKVAKMARRIVVSPDRREGRRRDR
jgi:hypothetical protein